MNKHLLFMILFCGVFLAWIPFSNSQPPTDAGAFWNFNEGFGDTAHDYSGNNNDDAYVDGVCTWPVGVSGNAIHLNGSHLIAQDSPDLDLIQDFTITAWISLSDSVNEPIVAKGDHRDNYNYVLQVAARWVNIQVASETGERYSLYSTYKLNDEQWYFVTAIKENEYLKLYIDGVSDTTLVCFTNSNRVNDQPLLIGYYPYGGSWLYNGSIDQLRIYSRALNDEEINALYHEGLEDIPTLSVLGIMVFTILLLSIGVIAILQKRHSNINNSVA